MDVEGRTLTISNLDKVLYPRTGTTKGEVLNYYARVAPVLLPHLADRCGDPVRWPHGVQGASFEKNTPDRDAFLGADGEGAHDRLARRQGGDTLVLPDRRRPGDLDLAGQPGGAGVHVHQWTVGHNGRPRYADRLVIDLDPGEPASLHECCTVALMVRDKLAERDVAAGP